MFTYSSNGEHSLPLLSFSPCPSGKATFLHSAHPTISQGMLHIARHLPTKRTNTNLQLNKRISIHQIVNRPVWDVRLLRQVAMYCTQCSHTRSQSPPVSRPTDCNLHKDNLHDMPDLAHQWGLGHEFECSSSPCRRQRKLRSSSDNEHGLDNVS